MLLPTNPDWRGGIKIYQSGQVRWHWLHLMPLLQCLGEVNAVPPLTAGLARANGASPLPPNLSKRSPLHSWAGLWKYPGEIIPSPRGSHSCWLVSIDVLPFAKLSNKSHRVTELQKQSRNHHFKRSLFLHVGQFNIEGTSREKAENPGKQMGLYFCSIPPATPTIAVNLLLMLYTRWDPILSHPDCEIH